MSPDKKKAASKNESPEEGDAKAKKRGGAAGIADELVEARDSQGVLRYAAQLEDEKDATANQAARVLQEVLTQKPELVVPVIERFARLLAGNNKRVIQCCAAALWNRRRIRSA